MFKKPRLILFPSSDAAATLFAVVLVWLLFKGGYYLRVVSISLESVDINNSRLNYIHLY